MVDEIKIVKEATREIYPNVEGRIEADMVSDIYKNISVVDVINDGMCTDKREENNLLFKVIIGNFKKEVVEENIEIREEVGKASAVKIVVFINVGIVKANEV